MRFSSFTIIALLSSQSSAFTLPGAIPQTFFKEHANTQIHRRNNGVSLLAVPSNRGQPNQEPILPNEQPKKKQPQDNNQQAKKPSKKEEKLKSLQESLAATEAKKVSLENELALTEAQRLKIQQEAEKAAKSPEGPSATSIGVGAGAAVVAAAASARSALQNRDDVKEDKKKAEAAKKAAAEQDARNRAAEAAKKSGEKKGSNTVRIFKSFFLIL